MADKDLEQLLIHLTAALDVFRAQKTTLTASDISLKSMLNVARLQVSDELAMIRMRGKQSMK